MYVYLCVYTYLHIYVYMIYICMCIYIYMCIYVYIHIYMNYTTYRIDCQAYINLYQQQVCVRERSVCKRIMYVARLSIYTHTCSPSARHPC